MRIAIDFAIDFAIENGLAGLALLLASATLSAQAPTSRGTEAVEYPPVYRVEVVVFQHVAGRSDRLRSTTPMDFTDRLDPLLVARANQWAERGLAGLAEVLPVAVLTGETNETTPYLETETQTLRPIPPVYSALGDLSRPIQRALDRLIDASEYDPLIARAWIQLAQRGQSTANMRIHDQTVVDLIEPDDGQSLVPVPDVLPFGPLVETPPPALDIYRLDGTARLRQRQFMHLDLDLVWQTRARALADRRLPRDDSVATADAPEAGAVAGDSDRATDRSTGEGDWQLHRLTQSRIVRPGRLEYFDSSLFGVLVKIERFEQVVPEIAEPTSDEPEPTSDESEPAPAATGPAAADADNPVTNSGR